jgi:hypothetical protein
MEDDMSASRELHGSKPMRNSVLNVYLIIAGCFALGAAPALPADQDKDTLIRDALSAAPPMIAETAKVMDWDGTV